MMFVYFLDDLNFEEPDSDVEFDDSQSQAIESDDDTCLDEDSTSEGITHLYLPAGNYRNEDSLEFPY